MFPWRWTVSCLPPPLLRDSCGTSDQKNGQNDCWKKTRERRKKKKEEEKWLNETRGKREEGRRGERKGTWGEKRKERSEGRGREKREGRRKGERNTHHMLRNSATWLVTLKVAILGEDREVEHIWTNIIVSSLTKLQRSERWSSNKVSRLHKVSLPVL